MRTGAAMVGVAAVISCGCAMNGDMGVVVEDEAAIGEPIPAEARRSVAMAESRAEGAWRDPQLRFQYGEREDEGINYGAGGDSLYTEDGHAWRAGVRLFPGSPFTMHARSRAGLEAESLAVAVAWREQCVVGADRMRAAEAVRHWEQRLGLEKSRVELCVAELDDVRVRLKSGKGTVLDEVEMEMTLQDAEGELLDAEARLIAARGAARALGAGEPFPEWAMARLPTESELIELVSERSPEVGIARAALRAVKREVSLASAARVPWLDHLQVDYGEGTSERVESGGGRDQDLEEWRISGALLVPLGETRADHALAQSRKHLAAVELGRIRAEVQGKFVQARARAEAGRFRVAGIEAQIAAHEVASIERRSELENGGVRSAALFRRIEYARVALDEALESARNDQRMAHIDLLELSGFPAAW